MAFKTSDSLEDLIADCKRESEAVKVPDEPLPPPPVAESSAKPSAAGKPSTTEQEKPPVRKQSKQKPVSHAGSAAHMRGKNGRAIKTDPYGNPIKKRKKDAPLRSEQPVQTVTPADIRKPQVSFLNSVATLEPASRARWTGVTAQAYDHAVLCDQGEQQSGAYRPKIRRMSDSTRAKELANRKRRSGILPYQKETPLQDSVALTGNKRRKSKQELPKTEEMARIPDAFLEQPYEDATPIQYVEKATHTQIDLSAPGMSEEHGIDIDVRYHDERRPRHDLPKKAKDFKKPEDKVSIQRDISELKTTLTLRVALLGLLTIVSAAITVLDWIPNIPMPQFLSSAHSPLSFLTIQILLGLLAFLASGDLLKNGLTKLLQLRADCDSLAGLSLLSAELSAVLMVANPNMLKNGVVSIYISVALLSVWVNAIAKKMIVSRAQRNFEVLSDGKPKFAVHYVEDEKRAESLTRGTLGDFPILATMQPAKNMTDFLKYTFSSDIADKFCRVAVPVVFLFSLIFSVFLGVLRADAVDSAICYGMATFSLCFAAAACTAITMVSNLPMATGTKRYVRNSGLLLGYQSVDDFFDVNTVMVDAATLFPQGSTQLVSIQVVGENRIEESLQYAASLTQHAGSILKDLFAGAILTEEQLLLSVENYAYEEGQGISGWIKNKRVLLGTREMMVEHNVEGLPAYTKETEFTTGGNEAIYLSVSGTVSALFVICLESSKTTKRWLHELEREHIHLIIRSNDALLSQRRIAKMFAFSEELLKIIPTKLEPDFEEETKPIDTCNPSVICAGRLPGFIQTIIGAKRIRSAAMLGVILQAVAACLGLLYVVVFMLMRAYADVSGGILLVYHCIWTLLTISVVHLKEV